MGKMVNIWSKIVQNLIGSKFAFPVDCILCLQRSQTGKIICHVCAATLPWLGPACQRCALPLLEQKMFCGKCLMQAPPFSTIQSLFHYAWPINGFITKLKYQGHLHFAKLLSQYMAEYLTPRFQVDCILPMPLHPSRQRQRGFNQTIEMAKPIAKSLYLPLIKNACSRAHSNHAQSSLSAAGRAENVRASDFIIAPTFQAQHVLVIEDVVTTGATISAFARALQLRGVETIEVWSCARAT